MLLAAAGVLVKSTQEWHSMVCQSFYIYLAVEKMMGDCKFVIQISLSNMCADIEVIALHEDTINMYLCVCISNYLPTLPV